MSAYDQLVKTTAAAFAAARAAEAVTIKPPITAAEMLGLPFKPGDRVVLRTTGELGTVKDGTLAHSVVPSTPAPDAKTPASFLGLPKPVFKTIITVLLDAGNYTQVDPAELVAVPAGLNVPLASLEPIAYMNGGSVGSGALL